MRYLRVVSDADPTPLALATWSTLLHRMPSCVADDDDDWLELATGTARETALASAAIASTATPAPDVTPAAPSPAGTGPESDPVDDGVAALRACGPAVADVLAMGVVAGLGRDSIARITGQEPTEVLALVQEGQGRLALPLESLMATMRVPGSPAEVGDLPAVLPLFAAQSHSPERAAATTAAYAGSSTAAREVAAAAVAAGVVAAAASPGEHTVIDLLSWGAPAPVTTRAALRRSAQADVSPRWARVGAGAAAWTIAVGGIGAAAAMTGVIPAALHNLFGDEGKGPVVVAHGPIRPGGVPSQPNGGLGTEPQPPGQQPGPQVPVKPATGPVVRPSTGNGVVVSASASGLGTTRQLVVVPAVLTGSLSPEPAPTTPSRPVTPPPTSTPQPPTSGPGSIPGAANAYGKGHLKHSTGLAKGRAKAAQAAAKAQAAAARAQAKAAAARARAAAKAASAQAKAAAKAAAAQARAAKPRV
jgi:hypothetical protein